MRISNNAIYGAIIRNLERASTDMYRAQEIVSTGKRINRPSDDPAGVVSLLDLRASLANIEQMGKNISRARSYLDASESALSQVDKILSNANTLAIQMATATTGASERANSVSLVDGYLREILSLANSATGGRYIFGGTNTDTPPFSLSPDESRVDFLGNETAFSIKIDARSNITAGKNGQDVFGETGTAEDIFKTIIDLKTSLMDNDINGIQESIDKLDSHMSHVNAGISDIAGKTIRLDIRENVIAGLELNYTERKSRIEEIDIAEAIIDLSSRELVYNAALSSASKVMGMSLVNFL
ncbi:flagellar hook-associated protein FlgL [Deltaproteobacteria bacterium]|nr:flagellar hook-associated protein FlgL [Deltaproteobacteria bacterium]